MPRDRMELLRSGARGSRPRGAKTCEYCGDAIWWCVTANGKSVAFSEAPELLERRGDIEVVSIEQLHRYHCQGAADAHRPPAPEGQRRFDDD